MDRSTLLKRIALLISTLAIAYTTCPGPSDPNAATQVAFFKSEAPSEGGSFGLRTAADEGRVVVASGSAGEATIVVVHELGQVPIRLVHRRDAAKPELFDEPVLKRLVRTLS